MRAAVPLLIAFAAAAACLSAPLSAGTFTTTLGARTITFTVPSTLPFGGDCE